MIEITVFDKKKYFFKYLKSRYNGFIFINVVDYNFTYQRVNSPVFFVAYDYDDFLFFFNHYSENNFFVVCCSCNILIPYFQKIKKLKLINVNESKFTFSSIFDDLMYKLEKY